MPKSVSVFLSELTDDVQRKLPEYFTTTASFLAGCSGGIRGEKRVKTDKEAVEESLSAPPFQNCKRHWRVNKPPADCWPLINTLFGSHGAECRNAKGAMRASKRCSRNLRQQTVPQAQHTGMLSAFAIKRCFYSSQNDVDRHKFLLGTQQWKHANEMVEQNPGHVCSCLMSWELWLHSEHLLQIFYTGFTQVCGAFSNTELR